MRKLNENGNFHMKSMRQKMLSKSPISFSHQCVKFTYQHVHQKDSHQEQKDAVHEHRYTLLEDGIIDDLIILRIDPLTSIV